MAVRRRGRNQMDAGNGVTSFVKYSEVWHAGGLCGEVFAHRDQAPQQFFGCPAAGGFPLQQIGQPVQPELFPVRGPRLGHPVGVQQHRVIRLKLLNARLGGGIAEPERQHRGTAELGDHLAAAQQQRPRMPGTRPLQPP